MPQFIVTNIFMFSFGGMLYLTARALPRLGDDEAKKSPNIFERLMKSGALEHLDEMVKSSTVKFLRKSKVHLLKIENSITVRLRKMSPDSSAPFGKMSGDSGSIDFKEMMEEKEGK